MSPSTLLPVPPILAGTLFAAVFFWLAAALGYRLMIWSRVPTRDLTDLEHGFVAAALGTGALQILPAFLAVFRVMTVTHVRLACLVLLALLVRDMAHIAGCAWRRARQLSFRSLSPAVQSWLVLLALVLGSLLMRALVFGNGNGGDDDGYHLSSPKRWLATGTLQYLPSYTHTNASLGFEMLYAIALSITDIVGAKMLHFCAGIFTLLGVYLCGRRLDNRFAAALTISLFLVRSPLSNAPQLFTAANADYGACWLGTCSVLLWLVWRKAPEPRLFAAFALCVGLAGSFKFTSLALGIAWVPVLLFDARKTSTWPESLAQVVRFGALAFLPTVPWLIRNLIVTGNPLYPMLASVIPTRDWTAEHAQIFSRYVRYYSWGVEAGPRLDEAARRAILIGTELALLLGGGLALWLLKKPVLRSILAFALIFTVISVALTGLVFRYWMPSALCGTLALLVGITQSWQRASRYWLASGVLALALVRTIHLLRDDSLDRDIKVAFGLGTFETEHPQDKLWEMWRFINTQTPPDSKVLAAAFYTTYGGSSFGGFWSNRPFYTTDSHLQTFIPFTSWHAFVDRIREEHITHVLIFKNQGNPTRHNFSFPAQKNEYPFCRRLTEQYGQKVAEFEDLQLYRVNPQEAIADEQAHVAQP